MPNKKARELRASSTDVERRLWAVLRGRRLRGYKFRRQRPIGRFIVDFACIERRLMIEADGGQHADDPTDAHRTAWLQRNGWRVIRFWNNDILTNTEGVLEAVLHALKDHSPSPPSPAGWVPLSRVAGEGSTAE
jgi:very-short-patch-repair endonuclease